MEDIKSTEIADDSVQETFEKGHIGYSYIESIRKGTYNLKTAIGDICDNSIDAGAKKINIISTGPSKNQDKIMIIDNGSGMDEVMLKGSYSLGFRRTRDIKQLGKFGLGGTMASLNLAANKITITKTKKGPLLARSYSVSEMKQKNAWGHSSVEVTKEMQQLFEKHIGIKNSGTIIVLSNFDTKKFGTRRDNLTKQIRGYIEKTYCEFIANSKCSFSVNGHVVESVDPLCWFHKDIIKLYDQKIKGTNTTLRIVNLKNVPAEYTKNLLKNHGGYIFRCDRLIEQKIDGSHDIWEGKIENRHNMYSWLRWGLFYDSSEDNIWNTSYNKTGVSPEQNYLDLVSEIVSEYNKQVYDEKLLSSSQTTDEQKELERKLLTTIANSISDGDSEDELDLETGEGPDEIDIVDNVIDLDTRKSPEVRIPSWTIKVAPLGSLGEPGNLIVNPDQSESKYILQLNSDHRYISKYHLQTDNNNKMSRDAATNWLLPFYVSLRGIPDYSQVTLSDFLEKFYSKLRKTVSLADRS